MSVLEFRSWLKYSQAEPFGPLAAYERAAVSASLISASMVGGKKAPKPTEIFPVLRAERKKPKDLSNKIHSVFRGAMALQKKGSDGK